MNCPRCGTPMQGMPFVIFPELRLLGTFGMLSIAGGAGDYPKVFSALTKMPKESLTYLSEFHSCWYLPARPL